MSLKLDDLKNFITVAKLKNVTRASEQLGLTQPAVTYSIKRLEEELGEIVFIRLKTGLELTKFGEEFLSRASKLLQDWQEAKNIFNKKEDEIVGEFKIGIHPSVAIYSLPQIFLKIEKKYPMLNFQLIHDSSRTVTSKVINFDVDFAIVVNPISHPDLVIQELGEDEVRLFKTPKNKSEKLIYDPNLAQSTKLLTAFNNGKVITRGHIESNSLEVIAKLAEQGVGIGLLPTRVAKGYKGLVPVKNSPVVKDTIALIYRVEKKDTILVKNIFEIIKGTTI